MAVIIGRKHGPAIFIEAWLRVVGGGARLAVIAQHAAISAVLCAGRLREARRIDGTIGRCALFGVVCFTIAALARHFVSALGAVGVIFAVAFGHAVSPCCRKKTPGCPRRSVTLPLAQSVTRGW